MSKINRHPVRRTAAGVLAGALALSGAVAAGTPAYAATGFALERIQGNDRYETSANIAAAFGPATSIILASGESGRTPDALAANFLAGVRNAPVLLTRRDTTPEPILTRLNALRAAGATRITVVGGTVAISDAQITALRALGFTVDRVAGANRYETAAEVAEEGEEGEAQAASNIGIVASGVSTIDALAGGPLAFKGRHPLFLVTRDGVPGATLAAMRSTGVTSVFILGGEAVVGPRVVSQLAAAGITVRERLAGADRSATSVAIANRLIADFGFSANTFNLASGVNEGIDALGGAALSGKENRVLLITNTATSAAPVVAFATARQATLNTAGRIFGGIAAVAANLETAVETAGAGTTGTGQATLPELVGAAVVSTTTAAQQSGSNPIGTRVRFTFDEGVTGTAPNAGDFFVYSRTGTRTAADAVTVEAGGNSVLARFAGIATTAAAGDLTVATVDEGAVADGQGNTNPEGDAAIGTGGTTTGGAAGVTAAPDLVSVGNFREGATTGTTAVDFTFDEAAFVTATAGFSLILTDGTERPCTGPAVASTNAAGGTSAGGNGTTVITVLCTNVVSGTTLTAANVARGSVASGVVRDGAAAAAPATDNGNPLQTVDVSGGGNTTSPDLVSAEFRPGATATDNDQVLFTFDEAVQAGTGAPGVVAANFFVYDANGDETPATSAARNPNNANQVLATFGTTSTDNAVGASVADGAVTAATGAATATNQQDEVGVANATQTVTVPGRTTGPDLTGVALSATTTDPFTNAATAFRAVYTFDEAVASATAARFFLFTSDGTRLTATNCVVGTAANSGTSTVRCDTFSGTAANGGTIQGAAVGGAVLGTVDASAVTAVDGGPVNPEGAEATTGGTGTRAS